MVSSRKKEHRRSCIVGITGGIGCGKTTVAEIVCELGYPVLFSDLIAQKLIASDKTIQKKLKSVFGESVFDAHHALVKKKLAEIVFPDSKKLQQLNEIVHPKTIAYIENEIRLLSGQNNPLIFVESALIYEAEIEGTFDYIIAVSSSPEKVYSRLAKRSGMSEAEIEKRILQQIPVEEKERRADFVIRNDDSMDVLRQNTKFILTLLTALKPKSQRPRAAK